MKEGYEITPSISGSRQLIQRLTAPESPAGGEQGGIIQTLIRFKMNDVTHPWFVEFPAIKKINRFTFNQ